MKQPFKKPSDHTFTGLAVAHLNSTIKAEAIFSPHHRVVGICKLKKHTRGKLINNCERCSKCYLLQFAILICLLLFNDVRQVLGAIQSNLFTCRNSNGFSLNKMIKWIIHPSIFA